jgi:hypothetical protein
MAEVSFILSRNMILMTEVEKALGDYAEWKHKLSSYAKQRFKDSRNHPKYGTHHSSETKARIRSALLGKKLTPEHCANIASATKIAWSTPTTRQNLIAARKLAMANLDVRARIKSSVRAFCENPPSGWKEEWTRKRVQGEHSSPNRGELVMLRLLESIAPGEFKFNGNYQLGVCLDRLVPDFVNVNGQKKIIELYGSWSHRNDDMERKPQRYAKLGYECFIVWDFELKDQVTLKRRLKNYVVSR